MRRAIALLVLLLIVLAPAANGHTVGNPTYVNFLLDHFETPDLAPGESGPFRVTFTNTYPWDMANITLRFEVYLYREIDLDLAVDTAWRFDFPAFEDPGGTVHRLAYEPPIPPLGPRESENITFTVLTDTQIPHGSLTKQGSYFVRTRLEFDFMSNGMPTNHSVMMSLGYFSREEFDTARRPCPDTNNPRPPCPSGIYYEGLVNMTYLGLVRGLDHLDGLLPDTGFSVKDRMPVWPFLAAGGIMGVSLVFALLFYAEENPGKYPRLARWWLAVKGRARPVRRRSR